MRTRALLAAAVTTLALTACGSEHVVPTAIEGGTPVPAVIGLRVDEAHQVLADAGFDVEEVQRLDCLLAQRAEATTPAPGTPIAPGSTVVLTYSNVGPAGDCAYTAEERVWRFLDWAVGRGADSRTFVARLGHPTAPPPEWEHAAEIAAAAFSLVPTGDGTSVQPTLSARYAECPPTADCISEEPWVEASLEVAGRPYASFALFLHQGRIASFSASRAPSAP